MDIKFNRAARAAERGESRPVMANIQQAAKWMQEGHGVRREEWRALNPELVLASVPVELVFRDATAGYGAGVDCVVNPVAGSRMSFSTAALLADDWEIAENGGTQ